MWLLSSLTRITGPVLVEHQTMAAFLLYPLSLIPLSSDGWGWYKGSTLSKKKWAAYLLSIVVGTILRIYWSRRFWHSQKVSVKMQNWFCLFLFLLFYQIMCLIDILHLIPLLILSLLNLFTYYLYFLWVVVTFTHFNPSQERYNSRQIDVLMSLTFRRRKRSRKGNRFTHFVWFMHYLFTLHFFLVESEFQTSLENSADVE